MRRIKSTNIWFSIPALLLAASGGCTTHEGDIIYDGLGGEPNQGPPGEDGSDGRDGEDGKDGRDGVPGQDGKDGKDGKDGGDGTGGLPLPEEYPSFPPECELVPLEELEIDLFAEDGHEFYFEVTPEMRVAQDAQVCDFGDGQGPVYQLGNGEESCPPAAFNVRVVPAGSDQCADTGKVELDLPGQSSWRPWVEIPNFKLDVGEFQDQKFATGDKTVRMNNGQADSTIVREATALAIWRAMGYPAPPTRFVRTQSNVWDYDFEPGVFAAHVMVQPYKKPFFTAELPEVTSAWEGEGNPFGGFTNFECEWSKEDSCEDDQLRSIVRIVLDAPSGEGFMTATEAVIDWPMIFQNQCLAALTGTGDDWIHNTNNVVIALRADGKIMYLPYSTDISGGHPWYPDTSYDPPFVDEWGDKNLATRCAEDPECRTMALDTCFAMIETFEQTDVVETIVKERCSALEETGLIRSADNQACEELEDFYGSRPDELRDELEWLREGTGGLGGAPGASVGAGGGIVWPID